MKGDFAGDMVRDTLLEGGAPCQRKHPRCGMLATCDVCRVGDTPGGTLACRSVLAEENDQEARNSRIKPLCA